LPDGGKVQVPERAVRIVQLREIGDGVREIRGIPGRSNRVMEHRKGLRRKDETEKVKKGPSFSDRIADD
jgi:hypothetical protein